ncbi:MAG: hypothetical protein ABIL09_13560 [Gemmatimonadota bacterium]
MDLQRIAVKLYLEDEDALSPDEAFRIFNAWIPNTPGEVLIDVTAYRHVGHGPLALLVGHEADYALDSTDGRPGLLYRRKQPVSGTTPQRLTAALLAALGACRRLEVDAGQAAALRFRGDELVLSVYDRLRAPNEAGTLEAVRPALEGVLGHLFAGAPFELERDPDPRHLFAVRVRSGAASAAVLLEHLSAHS